MNKKLLALYGLKWNPFSPELPTEALHVVPKVENFCWRVEQGLIRDGRLNNKLRRDELLPLGSRIRTRLTMEYAGREELATCLNHLLTTAGNAGLMTQELKITLCDHAVGNYRVLTGMADELLATAAQRELTQLDEKLFLEVFAAPSSRPQQAA